MSRVLVTGATGFVGSVLCTALAKAGYTVRAALRQAGCVAVPETAVVGDIDSRTDWPVALRDVECVIHLAARAHILGGETEADAYFEINERGTRRLATAAAQAGVRRFVFLSSVKVNGEDSGTAAYRYDDEPRPRDPYGLSKWHAERHLWEIAASSPMQAVVVRPPLVYGPGVKANFLRLLRWVDRELPLPLGRIENRRSLVSLWNLSDLLVQVCRHPQAVGRTWMVSDGEDLSTAELIRRIAITMKRRTRLLPVPMSVLRLGAALTGKQAELQRLSRSLLVDSAPTRRQLSWSPVMSVDDALQSTVDWYLACR